MDQYEIADFNIGSILSRTFTIIKDNIAVFIGLTAIAVVPSMLLEIVAPNTTILTTFIDRILALLVQGAMAYAVIQTMLGNDVSIGSSLSATTPHLGALFLAAILIGLVTVAGVLAAIFVGLVTVIGLALLVILMIIISIMWSVAIPSCVVEGLNAIDSIKRSMELTKGYRVKIFMLFFTVGLIVILILAIPMVIVFSFPENLLAVVILSVIMIIPIAFINVMSAILYYDLRVISEGITIESLASVFE